MKGKKILPSITDSSIEIGVIYLRIETGPNALLALFFFIDDGLALFFFVPFQYNHVMNGVSNYLNSSP